MTPALVPAESTLAVIDPGHFTRESAADEYAALVTEWWSANPAPDPEETDD